jgi:hypothetical protein
MRVLFYSSQEYATYRLNKTFSCTECVACWSSRKGIIVRCVGGTSVSVTYPLVIFHPRIAPSPFTQLFHVPVHQRPSVLFLLHRKKKVREFPVPSRDVTTKLSLDGNNDVITELFLPRWSLVSDIPAGDGKLVNLFLRCIYYK